MSANDPHEFAEIRALIDRSRADAELAAVDPEALRRAEGYRRRRRVAVLVAGALVLAAVGAYVPLTLLAPLPGASVTVNEPPVSQPAAAALVIPQVGASAVSLTGAELYLGDDGIVMAGGEQGPQPIASLSKVITALVVLEARPLGTDDTGPVLAFQKADTDLYDKYYVKQATVRAMTRGSVMSQRDVLETMLVASASNYAEALSTWAFGSQANFVAAATEWLAANGLTDTVIVEPTGIDPRNVSTPANLLVLARLALAHPVVSEIVGSSSVEVENLGTLSNTNALLGSNGVTGLKTGTLEPTGTCLLFSAVIEVGAPTPITAIGVVLGGSSRAAVNGAVGELLDSVRAGFRDTPAVAAGDVLGSYTTAWGDDAAIVAASTASVRTWSDAAVVATITTGAVTSAHAGATVGSVNFVAGPSTVSVPLVLDSSIGEPDAWWRLTHPAELLRKHD